MCSGDFWSGRHDLSHDESHSGNSDESDDTGRCCRDLLCDLLRNCGHGVSLPVFSRLDLKEIMKTCTWESCQVEAVHTKLDKFERPWAHLCDAHDRELNAAFKTDAKTIMRCWVKAKGGAKACVEEMRPIVVPVAQRLVAFLQACQKRKAAKVNDS